MMRTETGLHNVQQLVLHYVLIELIMYKRLENLGYDWNDRYRTVVVDIMLVTSLWYGRNIGTLPLIGTCIGIINCKLQNLVMYRLCL